MLYSDDFLVNSTAIIIAKKDTLIVAYMAFSFDVENELDRNYKETLRVFNMIQYKLVNVLKNCIIILANN